jgi:hypothetical protein
MASPSDEGGKGESARPDNAGNHVAVLRQPNANPDSAFNAAVAQAFSL